jgi:glycosyltransferase involved in cell wall biosynthesis
MIYFLIPFYNEEENIPMLAADLLQRTQTSDSCFVLVNDCSTDGTETALKKYFEGRNHIVLSNPVNSGPGSSFNTGFEWILANSDNDNDTVVTMEGDNTCDLDLLDQMLELNSKWKYDVVLSSVYAQGGGFSHTTVFRKLISASANLLLRLCYGIKALTLTSFYRVYNVSVLRTIQKKYGKLITEKGFICKLELLLKAIRCDARIIEVPMVLRSEKRKGKSKMKVLKTSYRYLAFLLKRKL